jgi:septal ring factor EnvC (AmiA/AmiB activator)
MSDIPVDYRTRLDLAELVARIERQQEEVRKFVSERNKLDAEAAKLRAEEMKLQAEERKLGRDRFLAPWLVIVAIIGGLITIAATIAHWKGWSG